MKNLTLAVMVFLALFTAGEACADLFTFDEIFLGTTNDLSLANLNNNAFQFNFDLTATGNNYRRIPRGANGIPTSDVSGFDPDTMTVTAATLYYTLSDNDRNADPVSIVSVADDGSLSIADFTRTNQLNLRGSQNFTYNFAASDFYRLSDGKFSLTVSSTDDIRLDQLRLVVQAQTPSQPVPIPASAWLLGAGLLGVVGIKRKTRVMMA